MASVGLDAIGRYKLGGVVPLKTIFKASIRVGGGLRRVRAMGTSRNGDGP
jgi:hypothetical protein